MRIKYNYSIGLRFYMKNLFKAAIVFVSLGCPSFEVSAMEDYANLFYFSAPVAVAIIMNCLSGAPDRRNDLEVLDVAPRAQHQEVQDIQIPPEVAQRFSAAAVRAMQEEDLRDAQQERRLIRLRRAYEVQPRMLGCHHSRT